MTTDSSRLAAPWRASPFSAAEPTPVLMRRTPGSMPRRGRPPRG
jgi:hypothetical protein